MKLTLAFLLIAVAVACQVTPDHDFKVPIKVVSIIFADGTELKTALPVGVATTWDSLAGKPLTFPPAVHSHSYNDLTDKPDEVQLQIALAELGIYLGKTTTELNAIVPIGGFGIALDKNLGVYKVYSENKWKIVATTN